MFLIILFEKKSFANYVLDMSNKSMKMYNMQMIIIKLHSMFRSLIIPNAKLLAINFEMGMHLIKLPLSIVAPFCRMKQPIIFVLNNL
jgi:hypothetical protein